MQNYRFRLPAVALAALILVSLACSLFNREEPQLVEKIPVTTESVEDLKQDIQIAAEEAQNTGRISLAIDEAELTSLIALELADVENAPVQEPQVALRDGQIIFSGNVRQGGFSAPLEVAIAIHADSLGQIQYEIVSGQVGPLPLSGTMLDELSKQLDVIFSNYIRSRLGDIFVENITVGGGLLTVEGRMR
ncbi:MAG: hypothetical protein PVF74_01275 [Anaerolineales bacterium]